MAQRIGYPRIHATAHDNDNGRLDPVRLVLRERLRGCEDLRGSRRTRRLRNGTDQPV